MAKKKMISFTADDAGDLFTPTVKVIKTGDTQRVSDKTTEKKKRSKKIVKQQPVKKQKKTKIEGKPVAAPKEVVEKSKVVGEMKPEVKKEKKPVEEKKVSEVKPEVISSREKKLEKTIMPVAEKKQPVRRRQSKDEETAEELVQLVGFFLVDEEFGIDIQKVQEINRMVEITPVPRTPEFIEGVINLRGKVVPVIQLRKRFGHPVKEHDNETRIVIVEVRGKTIGIIVDSVSEVLRIPASTIEPPPDIITGIDSEYIKGVGKLNNRLLILLDLDKTLSQKEMDDVKM